VADWLLEREPQHPQAADLVWRECQLTLAHGWDDQALLQLARFARSYPQDKRAPLAVVERAEVYFKDGDFAAAGDAFEDALVTAKRAGADTLARRIEKALPVCALREAEAAVAADSTAHERHAQLFEEVARRWPAFEHATTSQYRAGLAWLEAGRTKDGVRVLTALTERWPASPLARESRLRIAKAWEASGDDERAAMAWLEFSSRHPDDTNADEAWLKAADLCDSAGLGTRADELRAQYLKRWPNDQESALEILETLARKELAALPADKPVSSLLPVAAVPAKGAGAAKPALSAPASWLAQYMKRVARTPAVASKPLFAEVRFRFAEEAYQRYTLLALTQPLPKSIAAKQKQLDSVLVRYRRAADLAVPEWTHAATYRIGEALVAFGEALEKSERPKDLTGDDLHAYENVLLEQGQTFRARGETVWTDLLERSRGSVADSWTSKARTALWAHLGDRFLFQPEADFPTVEATSPGRAHVKTARDSAPADSAANRAPAPAAPTANEEHDR
jgi:outer membrane protein assembly factor BamD (BamD/ComL family)